MNILSRVSLILLGTLVLGGLTVSCKRKGADASGISPVANENTGVCVLDGIALRASSSKSGKFLANVQLGEVVKLLGGSEKDEAGKDYVEIELSDGKKGWATGWGIVGNATVGAIKEDAVVYKRPDVLTQTTTKLPFMAIVAVTSQKDDWVQVVGEGRKTSGWIQKGALTTAKEDVAVAVLATKKLREKDGLDQAKKIEAILSTTPFPSSFFIQKLKEKPVTPAAPPEVVPEAPAGDR